MNRAAIELAAMANLPTAHGDFSIRVYVGAADGKEHVALVRGDVFGKADVLTRLHSECMTGDVFASLRCDCRQQLELALAALAAAPCGVLLYMRQEGRGIGLVNKIRAYRLQEGGLDTVDANLALGFRDDQRDYSAAAAMLRELGVRSVRLLTNNPDKVRQLAQHGVDVSARLPHAVTPGNFNRHYLETKVARSGHLMQLGGRDAE
ncbi:MAG: GTP cyclohydrolase II [Pseudomonadota bacterium]